jgi:glycerophosphoryl diester phosphodiesterase
MNKFSARVATSALALIYPVLFCAGQIAPRQVQIHGHRGARAARPENTIPAFVYAIENGVDALELDMAVTKDNVVVVSHDPILRSPICSGPQPMAIIRQLTLDQVRQWDCGATQNPGFPTQQAVPGTRAPTLDEVFQLAPRGSFKFNIETKIFPHRVTQAEAEEMLRGMALPADSERGRAAVKAIVMVGPDVTPSPEEFVKLVLETIRKYHLEERVILQSFDYRTLHAMKRLAPEIVLSALSSDRDRSFVEIARDAGASIISPEYRTVTAEKVREAHSAGLQVVPWTADSPADWDALIAAGADAIITDDPAGLAAYLKRDR